MNAFDNLAKKASDSTSKSSVLTAAVDKTVATDVDKYVSTKSDLKSLEADLKVIEARIIENLRAQQDDMAYKGSFTKSLLAQGNKFKVTYVTADRFSVPQDEAALAEIKKVTGKLYDSFFETRRSISIRDEAIKNEETLNKLISACEAAKLDIGSIFDVGDKVYAKSDLDRKQYDLPKNKLEVFRTLVRQNKPGLK
jgi:hypothetical protein